MGRMARLTLRLDFGPGRAIGYGKTRLLEAVRDHGSISAAGRSMGMSYRRVWLLASADLRSMRPASLTIRVECAEFEGIGDLSLVPKGRSAITSNGSHRTGLKRSLQQCGGH